VFDVRGLDKDLELCEKATPGPLKWQKFGKQYYLTGQYGMRPIIFATVTAEIEGVCKDIHISNRDAERDLLIPLNPNHPDSKFVEEAWEALPYWLGEVKRLRELISESTGKMIPLMTERDLLVKTNAELRDKLEEAQAIIKAVRPFHICGGQSDYHDTLVSDYCEKEFGDND